MDFLSVFFFKFYINLALTIFILETWEFDMIFELPRVRKFRGEK